MKHIRLENFRCFEQLELELGRSCTLVLGDNASGKTSLLMGLKAVMSAFFSGFSDEHTRFGGLSKADFRRDNLDGDWGLAPSPAINISFDWLGVQAALSLQSDKGRTLQKPLKPLSDKAKALQEQAFTDKKQLGALPLLASFSTADIHTGRKINQRKFVDYRHKPSFAYYECLQGDGFLPYWTKRLLVLKEANRGELELSLVREAIQKVLGPAGCGIIEDLSIRPLRGQVFYQLSDGREVETEQLSDGYKRLVNIVIDLAFRAALLNGAFYQEATLQHTEGIVLIDEIELHLHPSLQVSIWRGLQAAFPKLQFILSSHAPMLMSTLGQNEQTRVYKLAYRAELGYSAEEVQPYGLDASTLLTTVLGLSGARDTDVEQALKNLFEAIDQDKYSEARTLLRDLQGKPRLQNLPDLLKAETMLSFLSPD